MHHEGGEGELADRRAEPARPMPSRAWLDRTAPFSRASLRSANKIGQTPYGWAATKRGIPALPRRHRGRFHAGRSSFMRAVVDLLAWGAAPGGSWCRLHRQSVSPRTGGGRWGYRVAVCVLAPRQVT